jgi:hypothetical protein
MILRKKPRKTALPSMNSSGFCFLNDLRNKNIPTPGRIKNSPKTATICCQAFGLIATDTI